MPHKCTVCDKQFTQLGRLKEHMIKHSHKRPHKCELCRKQFTHRSSLGTHMLRHTAEGQTNELCW